MKKRNSCLVDRKALSLGTVFLCMKLEQVSAWYSNFLKKFFMSMNFVYVLIFVIATTHSWLHAVETLVFRGDISPANSSSYTISRSGVYQLASAKTASGVPNITITANNVVLDLGGNTLTGGTNGIQVSGNNVVIHNGTIADPSAYGISLTGTNCTVRDCVIRGGQYGINLANAYNATLDSNQLYNATQRGISLSRCSDTTIRNCTINGRSGLTTDWYGLYAERGDHNVIDACCIQSLITTATAAGIFFNGELASKVNNSSVAKIEGAQSCGIQCAPMSATSNNLASSSAGTSIVTAALSWSASGRGRYVAVGTGSSTSISIYDTQGSINTPVVSQVGWGPIVGWHPYSDVYLATVDGSGNAILLKKMAFSFDPSYYSLLGYSSTCAWHPSGTFLLCGGTSGGWKLNFTGSALQLPGTFAFSGSTQALSWAADGKYVAQTTASGLTVYFYNGASFTSVATVSPGSVAQAAWSSDGQYVAATVGTSVNVYSFDGAALTLAATTNYGATTRSVSWSELGNYLMVTGDNVSGHYGCIYTFDGQSLVSYRDLVNTGFSGENGLFGVFSKNDSFYTVGNSSGQVREYYSFAEFENRDCSLSNNSVSGVSTTGLTGIGLFDGGTASYVASNVAYDCDISFSGVGASYITSQANARGVYNIDTNLTTPDQVEAAGDYVTASASIVDALTSNVSSIQTIVDNRYACSYTPITAATTIATPGVYCLANTISNGDLSVTATGVTLCLNGRTIYNGTLAISGDRVHAYDGLIRGKTAGSGVRLTGDKCTLNDLRVSNCLTGFELTGADQNTLKNCQATSCTREGYLLTNATYNTLSGCQSTGIVGTGTVAGMKTVGGIGNEITDCSVNRVQSSATGDAYGIWGVTESRSQLHDNEINDVSAVAGVAKGLALDENMWLQNAISFQATFSTLQGFTFNTVEWLRTDPEIAYLLCSNNARSKIAIFKLVNGTDFDLVLEHTVASATFSAQWLTAFGNYYVIIALATLSGIDVVAYKFDPVSGSLLTLPNATYTYDASGSSPEDIDVVEIDGTVYIAVGGEIISGAEVQILTFDGNYFGRVAQQEEGASVYNVEWLTTGTRAFLAVGRGDTPQVKAYEFLYKSSPTLVARGTLSISASFNVVNGLRWLSNADATYLACSTSSTSTTIRVLSFNPDAGTPLALAAQIFGRTSSGNPDWLVTGSTLYLAVPESQASVTDYVRILQFDPQVNSLTVFRDTALPTSARAWSTAWYTGVQGRAYLATGLGVENDNKIPLFIYGLDLVGSTTSVVQNNTVSNVSGTGIAVNELSNPTLSNRVYSATTPYAPWAPYRFDPSNEIVLGY